MHHSRIAKGVKKMSLERCGLMGACISSRQNFQMQRIAMVVGLRDKHVHAKLESKWLKEGPGNAPNRGSKVQASDARQMQRHCPEHAAKTLDKLR